MDEATAELDQLDYGHDEVHVKFVEVVAPLLCDFAEDILNMAATRANRDMNAAWDAIVSDNYLLRTRLSDVIKVLGMIQAAREKIQIQLNGFMNNNFSFDQFSIDCSNFVNVVFALRAEIRSIACRVILEISEFFDKGVGLDGFVANYFDRDSPAFSARESPGPHERREVDLLHMLS